VYGSNDIAGVGIDTLKKTINLPTLDWNTLQAMQNF